jgi:hypothetical protein
LKRLRRIAAALAKPRYPQLLRIPNPESRIPNPEPKAMPLFLPAFLRRRLERLRFPQLALLTGLAFLVTLVVPDPLPFIDEIVLGLSTLLLASWKKQRSERRTDGAGKPGERPPIEGEAERVDRG